MNGPSAGLPRVYDIVLEFISHVDAQIDAGPLHAFIAAYQTVGSLKFGEHGLPLMGCGDWTWYTGSAGWMYRLLVEALLGVHLEGARSIYQSRDWLERLMAGPVERLAELPQPRFPMVARTALPLAFTVVNHRIESWNPSDD